MANSRQSMMLGFFVLVSFGLLAGLVLVFGGQPDWFKQRNSYVIRFSDAPGIGQGTQVRKSGVRVGEVKSVELDNQTGEVRVRIVLDAKFTPRASDEAIITRGLIVGESTIDFVPRASGGSSEVIPPGSEMIGIAPFNARALINSASDVVPEAQKSLEQIRKSLEAVEKMGPQIQTTVKEFGELARAAREFIPELRKTNDAIRDLFGGDDSASNGNPEPAPAPKLNAWIDGNIVLAQVPKEVAPKKENPPGVVIKKEKLDLREVRDLVRELGPAMRDLRQLGPEVAKTTEDIRYFLRTATFWLDDIGVKIGRNEPKIARAIDAFSKAAENLNRTLSPENQRTIAETLKNIQQASTKFNDIAMSADAILKDGRVVVKNLNTTLLKADGAIDDIRAVTRPLAESLPRVIKQVEGSINVATEAVADIRDLVRAIGKSEGTFHKFISDLSLYNNVNVAVASVGKLGGRLDRILKDIEVFADKVARHPEILGIGGAVKPDSGLKTVPSTPNIYKPENR